MGRFKLRQEPGEKNALGLIKFIFPNNYSVYMHDTPARALFQRSSRAFSHGCIRLEKPVKLADFLMSDFEIDWSKERFHEIIDSGKRTIIRLPEPLPVHITYQTAKSDQDGTTFFHTDIYDRDRKLEQILFKE
jgi:murein L,D-transpeptidase YcbB/YkuD